MTKPPIRIEGHDAFIPLTRGYEAVVDVADLLLVAGHSWYAKHNQIEWVYAATNVRGQDGGRTTLRMHRVLMGAASSDIIDHRDGDTLNNRRSNLRRATPVQNACNQRITHRNSSGFKGVSLYKPSGKWRARIKLNGRMHFLGYHQTPEAAHAAYCKASAELHGEFGRTA